LGETLGLTPEELLGYDVKSRSKSKPGPTSKLQQQIERINQLPRSKQRFVMEMLDMVISQAQTGH
jgi:hypothetical protein